MGLSKSFEDYLEAIYLLKKENGNARVKDIAKSLEVKLPSVTEAIKKLSKLNVVYYKKYGNVELTKKGREIAKDIYKKHEALFLFLTKTLKIKPEIALKEACGMEHSLSSNSCKKLSKFIKKEIIYAEK